MSGKAVERMREILNATGAYRLTGETSADWELNACGAGFSLAEEAVEELLAGLFAATASPGRLGLWEKAVRGQSSSGTVEERRASLAGRFSMNPRRFTPGDFPSLLLAAGLRGAVQEKSGGLRVVVGKLMGVPEEEVRRELDRLLPAHLPWEWDSSVSWEALDAWLPDCAALEARGLSWEELDALTREQLEDLAKEGS